MSNLPSTPETLVVVSTRLRDPGQLDAPWTTEAEPSIDAIKTALSKTSTAGTIVFGGGEPTLRADFPSLVSLIPDNGVLATDGLALHKKPLVKALTERGLQAVRIPVHSARPDAHNWLVGIPGAHRRACTAIGVLLDSGVDVGAEVTITRPTMPYLEETVAFLFRNGIRKLGFRMLERRGAATDSYITLAPRFGLMEPALESALQVALRHGMDVSLSGIPHCAAPRFRDLHQTKAETIFPKGINAPTPLPEPDGGCEGCTPECIGAPKAYTDIFGWTEFGSQRGPMQADNHAISKPISGVDVPWPPPRARRTPATRVQDAVTQSMRYDLDGDPIVCLPRTDPPDVISIRFPATESTRSIRKRLVQAAQEGATTLHVVGGTTHDESLPLLREAQRLSFPRVVLSGDVTGLADAPPNKLFQLRGLALIQVPSDGDNIAIAERIRESSSVPFEVFLTLGGSQLDTELCHLWSRNSWPGEPRFAVAEDANIESLRSAANTFPDCPERNAIIQALDQTRHHLSGYPGSEAIQVPDGVSWPHLPPFKVQ